MITVYSDLPYVHAGGDGGVRSTTQCVVIHATDNTASAQAEASYARTRADHTSAHFYVDEAQVIQALPTDHIAYGCYPIGNGRSVQLELVGLSDHVSDATMRRAAPVAARVCRDWGIPARKVGPAELVAGVRGICGHGDVTAAWHQGDHTDPGPAFPWDRFINYVQGGDQMALDGYVSTYPDHGVRPDGLALTEATSAVLFGTTVGGGQTAIGRIEAAVMKLVAAAADPTPVSLTDAQLAQFVDGLVAKLPQLTRADVEEALRNVLRTGTGT